MINNKKTLVFLLLKYKKRLVPQAQKKANAETKAGETSDEDFTLYSAKRRRATRAGAQPATLQVQTNTQKEPKGSQALPITEGPLAQANPKAAQAQQDAKGVPEAQAKNTQAETAQTQKPITAAKTPKAAAKQASKNNKTPKAKAQAKQTVEPIVDAPPSPTPARGALKPNTNVPKELPIEYLEDVFKQTNAIKADAQILDYDLLEEPDPEITVEPEKPFKQTDVPEAQTANKYDVWEMCTEHKTTNPLYRYGFRLTKHEKNEHLFKDPQLLEKVIKGLDPSVYIYQKEKGEETQKEHFQGYFKLKSKIRPKQLAILLNKEAYGIDVRPAFDEAKLVAYCQKEETRLEGPWAYPPSLCRSRP